MSVGKQSLHRQIPLSIQLDDSATFENFYAPTESSGDLALSALQNIESGHPGNFFYLWGSSGSGRSHLLQALCQKLKANWIYLPLGDFKTLNPSETLADLDSLDLVVLDDIDQVCGQYNWAEMLFHLYNHLQEKNAVFVVSSSCSPKEIISPLEDLKSRLSAMQVFRLAELNDDEIMQALQLRATRRGFELPEAVGQYLLRHFARSMRAQIQFLDRLDLGMLEAKRKLTLPLLKEILEEN